MKKIDEVNIHYNLDKLRACAFLYRREKVSYHTNLSVASRRRLERCVSENMLLIKVGHYDDVVTVRYSR